MKKIYFILFAVAFPPMLFAQTVLNAGMETWRTSPAGHTSVQTPVSWFGSDSTVLGIGESTLVMLALGTTDADWNRQIFEESAPAFVHSGTYSAKIMTMYEDSFLAPGVLTNAIPSVAFSISPPGITNINIKGGSPATAKPTSVSAWVQYYAGKDTTGATGIDSGRLTVSALGQVGGRDSIIGTGSIVIGPASSWTQVTANIVYLLADTSVAVDTFQITFSSAKTTKGLDSSTLYVDDVSMTTIPNPDHTGVQIVAANDLIKVYPNPANGTIYFDGLQNAELTVTLFSISGQSRITKTLAGNNGLDVSLLPSGLYFYSVNDNSGNTVQRGKVAINR